MIKLESSKMQKAIERAKAVRPRVRWTGERNYSVTGSQGNAYSVRFVVTNGLKLAECNCQAGQRGQLCYHVAAAAAVNVALHSNYSRPSESPEASTRAEMIAAITATWSARFTEHQIAAGLMARFGVNDLRALGMPIIEMVYKQVCLRSCT